mmetsp:Transcript_9943/g.16391  ORF Transcript_9943/g.16391 Transcript_9943/m.16391 type:complete len:137 (+) Transcript_9943:780-1190(+)
MLSTSESFHSSRSKDLTKDKLTPRPLCFPAHSKHKSDPKVTEAHSGFFEPQSTHSSFPASATISFTRSAPRARRAMPALSQVGRCLMPTRPNQFYHQRKLTTELEARHQPLAMHSIEDLRNKNGRVGEDVRVTRWH